MARFTKEIKEQVLKIVNAFNEELKKENPEIGRYVVTFKGKYIYINTFDKRSEEKACRLIYDGDLEDLYFEIFKFSTERYTDDTFGMPGEEYEDGTVLGALNCVYEMYPPM